MSHTWFERRHAASDQKAHILVDYDEPVKYGDELLLRTACGRTIPAGNGHGHRQVDTALMSEDAACAVCARKAPEHRPALWPIEWSRVDGKP